MNVLLQCHQDGRTVMSPTPPLKVAAMKDSPNLDLLRALAVGLVVLSHAGVPLYIRLEPIGRIGVSIFFVHTCLVLMQSMERNGSDAMPFLTRRFFRIYPLAVVAVLLMAIGHWIGGMPDTPRLLISNLLLVQNLTGEKSILDPLWSLPYEVQMYLLLPLLYRFARAPSRVFALWVGSAIAILGMTAAGLSTLLVQWAPCFLAGVLAFALPRRPVLHPTILFAAALAAAIIAQRLSSLDGPLHWLICLGIGLLIPFTREIGAHTWLARGAKAVAKYSYSIYITHVIAIGAAFGLFPALATPVKLALCLLVMAMFARVCYRWIEAPGMAIGARIADRVAASKRQNLRSAARVD